MSTKKIKLGPVENIAVSRNGGGGNFSSNDGEVTGAASQMSTLQPGTSFLIECDESDLKRLRHLLRYRFLKDRMELTKDQRKALIGTFSMTVNKEPYGLRVSKQAPK